MEIAIIGSDIQEVKDLLIAEYYIVSPAASPMHLQHVCLYFTQ